MRRDKIKKKSYVFKIFIILKFILYCLIMLIYIYYMFLKWVVFDENVFCINYCFSSVFFDFSEMFDWYVMRKYYNFYLGKCIWYERCSIVEILFLLFMYIMFLFWVMFLNVSVFDKNDVVFLIV